MRHPFLFPDLSLVRRSIGYVVVASLALTACRDVLDPVAPTSRIASPNESEGRGFAHRLYAIGTSISAGTCSDGNVARCQRDSWVAQIIRAMHREPILPLIQATGCKSPIVAPLILFRRESGEPITIADDNLSCAPNEPGVTFPTQVLAVPGALTYEALFSTPDSRPDPSYGRRLYHHILPPFESQVSALEDTNPKFVTVELGLNDIIGVVRDGMLVPGVNVVPFAFWSNAYNQVLDRVGAVADEVLLVGLGTDISRLNALRSGNELWADRTAFLTAFNVAVSANCEFSTNMVVVPFVVPTAVGTGLFLRSIGSPFPFTLSCAEGAATAIDRILTPAEVVAANAQFELMNDHIRAEATLRGYAFIDLEVLFNIPKGTFSVVSLMTSLAPYGPNISFDGLHPSAAGHTLIAQSALQAIEDRYHFGLDAVILSLSTSPPIRNR